MLEIKNLCKTYKTKGNVITKALDNVSITFPQTGMVFLLGKSGSGKSTLLNLCGGLDTPDSGEIIVKGRSSKTFSGSDFDSYRNTFIGFVFQEYNILNEFSVEDNIALALELQGKSKDKEKINNILKQVELENFAKRKPNTLSGGQKQRIAIARALIKDPEIIMADEPTGALDSNTGKQVLETLKKLAETKLVIIVSHDREFAEIYGSRIIELKDGKILSDMTKEQIASKQVGNITLIDNHTISIRQGTQLNDEDIQTLNDFLKSSKEEILISNHEKDISNYKAMARIGNNSRESFAYTEEKSIEKRAYTPAESKLIRSKLPLRHASRIGVSSLRLKPIRLLFTILLSVTSFILLGVVSTMMFYNRVDVSVNSFANSDIEYISVQKAYTAKYSYDSDYYFTTKFTTFFSDTDTERLKTKYGNNTIFYYNFESPSEIGQSYYSQISISNINSSDNRFYSSNIIGFSSISENHPLRQNILCGSYPVKDTEILISSYTFESLQKMGLRDSTNTLIPLNSKEDILNKTLYFYNNMGEVRQGFTVCGVYDVDSLIPQKYKDLKTETNSRLQYEWQEETNSGIYSLVLVADSFYTENKKHFIQTSYGDYISAGLTLDNFDNTFNQIGCADNFNLFAFDGSDSIQSTQNAIYPSTRILYEYIYNEVCKNSEITDKFYEISPETNLSLYDKLWYFGNVDTSDMELINNYWKDIYSFLEENQLTKIFTEPLKLWQIDRNLSETVVLGGYIISNYVELVLPEGLYDVFYYNEYKYDSYYTTKYTIDKKATVVGALIYNTKDKSMLNSLITENYLVLEDDSTIQLNSYIMDSLEMVNSFIENMTTVFLWAGIVMAIFATLLLFNFISVSISNKKKEIGILRAVGARGTDVFKIFFSESIVIVMICFILALIGNILICSIINVKMGEGLSGVNLLVFGPKSIILIFGISILVSFISTFLPVYSIARKKPVDSIRSL